LSARMSQIVYDLLKYSRLGIPHEELEQVNIVDALRTVCDDLQIDIHTVNAQIRVNQMPTIRARRFHIEQLFKNLIANALKYKRAEPVIIAIAAREEGPEWVISVNDNGIGIPDKDQRRIFNMLERLHSHSQYSGNGIGLALCKKIMEIYDGRIWVESELGVGSTFNCAFPAEMINK
jgi:chemotaxis family two-component system sensor kinase Cph1